MAPKRKKPKHDQSSAQPSSNWIALKQKLNISTPPPTSKSGHEPGTLTTNKKGKRMRSSKHDASSPTTADSPRPTIASTIISSLRGRPATPSSYPKKEGAVEAKLPPLASTSTRLPEITHVTTPKEIGKYLALDCEMVGVGPEGEESSLARVSIVNYHGHLVLDTYVKQREAVTDYRTAVSGIRPEHVHGPNAVEFQDVQKQVADLLKDRVLVGHAVHNDLKALMLTHPKSHIRDTQKYKPLRAKYKTKYLALKVLAKQELGMDIQIGEHNSVIDAQATMLIYRKHKKEWDTLQRPPPSSSLPSSSRPLAQGAKNTERSPTGPTSTNTPKRRLSSPVSGDDEDDSIAHVNDDTPSTQAQRRGRGAKQAKTDVHRGKAKAKVSAAIGRPRTSKTLSSGISVVVQHNNGRKDILGKKGRTAPRDGAGGGVSAGAASTAGWWQTI